MFQTICQILIFLILNLAIFPTGSVGHRRCTQPSNDCILTLNQSIKLFAGPIDDPFDASPGETLGPLPKSLNVSNPDSIFAETVLAVCPGDSCTRYASGGVWNLTAGLLDAQASDFYEHGIPLAANSELVLRRREKQQPEVTQQYCVYSNSSAPAAFLLVPYGQSREQASDFWICEASSTLYNFTEPKNSVWFRPASIDGCTNVHLIARYVNATEAVRP